MWLKSLGWISVRPYSLVLFKNSLAWFLLLKNLWKTKSNVWMNELIGRSCRRQFCLPKMWKVASFLCGFFFLCYYLGNLGNQIWMLLIFWYLKKSWGIKHHVPARVWLKDFVRQIQSFKNTLLLILFHNFQGDIKVFIVCETDHSLYELLV